MFPFWYDFALRQRTDDKHAPGEDEWGYEEAGERWLPVHTVESVVSTAVGALSVRS